MAGNSETARELTDAQAGLIVPAGEPAHLLDALDQVRQNAALASGLSARGVRFAAEHLTPAASYAAIDQFIAALASARRVVNPHAELAMAEGD